MKTRIKSPWLAVLSLIFIIIFISLGFWQLSRANTKAEMLYSFQQRTQLPPASAAEISGIIKDWRYYQVKLEGTFDDAHSILLDNKIFNSRVGYEVYTPFTAKGMSQIILVDRGFVPMGANRATLPAIPKTASGVVTIHGMLNNPPLYQAFGGMSDNGKIQWPLRVEYISLPQIFKALDINSFYPYIVSLGPASPGALQVKWQVTTVDPAKNKGYAVQWFALALTLLIISVALNRTTNKKTVRRKKRK